MEITVNVNINAPELCSTIRQLFTVMAASSLNAVPEATAKSNNQETENTNPNPTQKIEEKPKSKLKPEPKQNKNSSLQNLEPKKNEVDTAHEVTLEQVRKKLAALAQDGKQVQVKELITKFGASKLTEVPTEKYPELLAEAEKIA